MHSMIYAVSPLVKPSGLTVEPVPFSLGKDEVGVAVQKRCGFSTECKKKLCLSDLTCDKCKARFCGSHRLPEAHACQHDFKKEGKATLTAQNPRCVAEKVDRI
jgi:hypothetical protein